jgi:hypothetical protein
MSIISVESTFEIKKFIQFMSDEGYSPVSYVEGGVNEWKGFGDSFHDLARKFIEKRSNS